MWSPDGKYIAYSVTSDGKISIVRKPSDGSGAEETLLTLGPEITPSSVVAWSPDAVTCPTTYSTVIGAAGQTGAFLYSVIKSRFSRAPLFPVTSLMEIFRRTVTG